MSQSSKKVRFPDLRIRLIGLAREDQKIRKSPKFAANDQLFMDNLLESDRRRAEEVLVILETIKTPSVDNIGIEGSRAVWLIAQHNSDYKDLGEIVLKKMTELYRKDKNQVYYQGIPYLTDRIMVFKQLSNGVAIEKMHELNLHVKQLYGTQFWTNPNGKHIKFKIIKPKSLQSRRQEFGLTN